MNAAIRAVVRTALNKGLKVKGIQKGYNGLLNDEIIDMDKRSVADIIQRGGTVLYTARCMEFMPGASPPLVNTPIVLISFAITSPFLSLNIIFCFMLPHYKRKIFFF